MSSERRPGAGDRAGLSLNGRYRLDAELGRGGMSVVYRGHDRLLDRDVAVKVLGGGGLNSERREHLLAEAKAAARLNHPNIVSVYDAGETGDSPFIVMELVDGESLHDHHPHDLDEILSIVRQVCAALEHAHHHGIVHRDLKPENVLITADGTAKLADFGLARTVASRLTSEGAIVGTVFYLAPEQVLGGEIDARTDLYALGVMLYELVTGRLPFIDDDPVAVISQHLQVPPVPPRTFAPALPASLEGVILKLLAKAPAMRYDSAREVGDILFEISGHQAPAVPAAPPVAFSLLQQLAGGRLIGRQRELAELRGLWAQARVAWAGLSRTVALYGLGDLAGAVQAAQGSLAKAEWIGDMRLAVLAGGQLSIYQTDLGQDDLALETANRAMERSEKLGQVMMRCTSLHALGYFHGQRQEWAQAASLYRECYDLVAPADTRLPLAYLGPSYALACMALGRLEEAALSLDRFLSAAHSLGSVHYVAVGRSVQGQLLQVRGDGAGAIRAMDESVDTLRDIGSRLELGRALYRRSLMRQALGDAVQARHDRTEAQEILRQCGAARDYERAHTD